MMTAQKFNVSAKIHPDDFIFRFLIENSSFSSESAAISYYFSDGRESAVKLKGILKETDLGEFASVLEFASGYGCVSRHFREVLPDANLTVSDIHSRAHVFSSKKLGLNSIISNVIPEKFFPGEYDCVFALSFFSHMPPKTWQRWLSTLWAATSKGGILVFTTQGLKSAKYFGEPEIPSSGIWFHADSEQKDLDVNEYGQTLVTEQFVRRAAESLNGMKALDYRPGSWWNHQDLYILRKIS